MADITSSIYWYIHSIMHTGTWMMSLWARIIDCMYFFFCCSNTFSCVARPFLPRRRPDPLRTLTNSTSPPPYQTLSKSTGI
jgi:hypothetical protein